MGKSTLPNALIADYIGDGAAMLVRRALGDPGDVDAANAPAGDALFHRAFDLFLEHYRVHKLDNTRCYEGVLDSLRAIASGSGYGAPAERPLGQLDAELRPASRFAADFDGAAV